ncbi:MAG: molybdopterin-dependent oxidoreductase [Acidimicrobiales bacterium]
MGSSGGSARADRGPFSAARWQSPVRGPWLTSMFGVVLLVGIPIEFVTGLLSYAAYDPRLGNPPNSAKGIFGLYLFNWVTRPSWLYRVIEGTHVFLGLVLVPVVLAKLWSVMPTLFEWPPWRSVAQFLERVSLVLVVGGIVFEMATGILNIDYFTQINFYSGHFYGAWAFMAGFAVHVGVKFGDMVRALRTRSLRTELRTGLAGTRPETVDSALIAPEPAAPTISRRGVLALVGGTSLAVSVLTAGETIGGGLRRLALFGTHYRSPDSGANHFPVNHTAASAGITASATGPDWRLSLVGTRHVSLSRDQLSAMPLTTADLPIACTEGWSTQQRWTGVPLGDLARLAGVGHPGPSQIRALDDGSIILSGTQISAPDSLLALRVNGADLSLDHGYPARIIVPSAPGTHNLKWMREIVFSEEA